MRKIIILLFIFFITFIIYFGVGTKFTFKPKWTIDYLNQMTEALFELRLDLKKPPITYDLAEYKGKWYLPSGILPALFFIPLQLIKERYAPSLYIAVFFASLNVVVFYLILNRIKKEFIPDLSKIGVFFLLILFAFGTTNFYVGTLGSNWHVEQIVTSFFGTLGFYIIFKKRRKFRDYLFSSILFSLCLLGRPTVAFLISFPIMLFLFDHCFNQKSFSKINFFKKIMIAFITPWLFFSSLLFIYNYSRFHNPLEYGFNYIHESPYLEEIRRQNGNISLKNMPNNLWHMLFEIPSISYSKNTDFQFNFNLNGNSIFFLTPPLITVLLAFPFTISKKKIYFNLIILSLWISIIITIMPSLLHYSTGWMQFGYRYSLDILIPMMILSIFGIKGKLNILYVLGIFLSIIFYSWGIVSLY